nr:MAG TPA: hypothetical protein [Caudoviricetes sp.]
MPYSPVQILTIFDFALLFFDFCSRALLSFMSIPEMKNACNCRRLKQKQK